MKRLPALLLLLATLLCGCTRTSDFNDLKNYLDRTTPGPSVGATLHKKLKSVFEPLDKGVPFLLQKAKSDDPTDAVTAYLALVELCSAVAINPTPKGQVQVDLINPQELYENFEQFDPTILDSNWRKWFEGTHAIMKRTLETDTAAITLRKEK